MLIKVHSFKITYEALSVLVKICTLKTDAKVELLFSNVQFSNVIIPDINFKSIPPSSDWLPLNVEFVTLLNNDNFIVELTKNIESIPAILFSKVELVISILVVLVLDPFSLICTVPNDFGP